MSQQSQVGQQPEPEQQDEFTIKAWLLRKAGQYLDGILINGVSALIFGGALWLLQRFWGLRLIPFNVLDAILLSLAVAIVIIMLMALIVFLLVSRFLSKHPEAVFGLVLGLFAGLAAAHFMAKQNTQNGGGILTPYTLIKQNQPSGDKAEPSSTATPANENKLTK